MSSRALPEWRNLDGEDGQPVVEVRPEPTFAQVLLQVAVRGGDDPDVDLARRRRAETLDLAVLDDAEELCLEGRVEVADLVEEERPAVGELSNRPGFAWVAPVNAPFS